MGNAPRRKAEPRHIRLYHSMTGTEAFMALSGNAIKVLIALVRLDNGVSNGDIFLSSRTAAKATGLTKNTAYKCLTELEEKGFIRKTEAGRFHPDGGIASKYRYTWQAWPGKCGPTREYEKWKPDQNKKLSQKLTGSVPNIGLPPRSDSEGVSNNGTDKGAKAQKPVKPIRSNIGTQLVYQQGDSS